MAAIILPRRHYTQPQDQANLVYPAKLLASPYYPPRVIGTPVIVPTVAGVALRSNPYRYPPITGLTNKITLVVATTTPDVISHNKTFISQRSAWSATGVPFEVTSRDSNGTQGISVRLIGNTDFNHKYTHETLNLVAGLNTFVVTWDGETETMYSNGVVAGSRARTGSITNNTTDCAVGSLPNGLEQGPRDYLLVAVYDYLLPSAREVSANPWQLFRADPVRIYSLPTIPTLSNPGVIDITASSARPQVTLTY